MMAQSHKNENQFDRVGNGRIPGIYTQWTQCQEQTNKFSGECHVGFETLQECLTFMKATATTYHYMAPEAGNIPYKNGLRSMARESVLIRATAQNMLDMYN